MPMDRKISVSYTPDGEPNRFGEYEPGEPVTLNLWATQLQDRISRTVESFGVYGVAARAYRIRYHADLVRVVEAGVEVTVTDEGYEQIVESVGEPDGTRRRFLDVLIRE